MENFTYAKDGDIALVASISPNIHFKENDVINEIVFPDTVEYQFNSDNPLILENFIDYETAGNIEITDSKITITNAEVEVLFSLKFGILLADVIIKYTNVQDNLYKFMGMQGGILAWVLNLFGNLDNNILRFKSPMKILKDISGDFSCFVRYEDNSTFTGLYKYMVSEYDNMYINIDTQLKAIKDKIYLATFMGANSVAEVGELQNVNSLNTAQIQLRHNIVKLYSNLSTTNLDNLYKGMNTITVANMDDLDTSNVTTAVNMFYGCTNLTTITQFDISNVTNISNMFTDCNNLSAVTYENIANMLPQANNLTNQYLSNIGLNVNNFTANQINILNNKGYVDAIPIVPTVQSYYRIKWE